MTNEYDLVILGGGMGGYVAAIRASQLGLKTAIVEKDKIGGTCLHRGCIPSKAMLKSAEVFQMAKKSNDFGIEMQEVKLNFMKVQEQKNSVVDQLYKGLSQLVKNGKIDLYEGKGRLLGPSIFSPLSGTVSVEMNNGQANETLIPKNVIIATGAKPRELPSIPFDQEYILSSDDALQLTSLPSSISIVGGGAIGIEWASMMNDFGVDVSIIESASQILPTEDKEIAEAVKVSLKNKGVNVVTNAKILDHTVNEDIVTVQVESNNSQQTIESDKLLVCIGREAILEDIGLENTEITIQDGRIHTNDFYQTSESHIYAVGDCIGGHQLAHVASREGMIAVEHIAGLQPLKLEQTQIPSCIYSHPEVARVGLTEQAAKEQNYNVKIGKFPFKANSKALINQTTEGFVKIVVDAATDDLLGIHMIGSHVTEMISEVALAKVLDAIPWEIAQTIHPHPSMSETIAEAALAVDGLQLHL